MHIILSLQHLQQPRNHINITYKFHECTTNIVTIFSYQMFIPLPYPIGINDIHAFIHEYII